MASDAGVAAGAQSKPLQGPQAGRTYSLIAPKSGRFKLQISGLFGFTGRGSIVRVREFQTEGTGLHFSGIDMNTEQMPSLDLRYGTVLASPLPAPRFSSEKGQLDAR
ncbi:MAG: hypothetical protein WA005_11740 [Candidatus Binataceae bacterium]